MPDNKTPQHYPARDSAEAPDECFANTPQDVSGTFEGASIRASRKISNRAVTEAPDGCFAIPPRRESGTFEGASGKSRIISFDLARGFTVLFMPSIHVVMLYSTAGVQHSALSIPLRFIAEGPGAQLFMLLMGVNFAFKQSSSNSSPQGRSGGAWRPGAASRAFHFLIAAYLLNFFKFLVPLAFGFMPSALLNELNLQNEIQAATFFFFIGDILHFAAIAGIILYVIARSAYYPYISLIIAAVVIFLSPYAWDLKTGYGWIDRVIVLFNGHPPDTFFPLLPWLVYPLIGLTLGYILKRHRVSVILKGAAMTGFALILFSLMLPATVVIDAFPSFYRTYPADTLFHLGFVLVWIGLVHWVSKRVADNYFFRLLKFCSRHITSIYIIQWILICWCMAFTGYGGLNLADTIVWMLAVTAVTLLLSWLITKPKQEQESFK